MPMLLCVHDAYTHAYCLCHA